MSWQVFAEADMLKRELSTIWRETLAGPPALTSARDMFLQRWMRRLKFSLLEKGKDGLVIGKTVQAIVIARYVDPMIAGNTSETVQKLVDYLVKVGY
ncbi:predicted protein [Sclerotinia sclerotiorum 1980 UF-70]|uniref:Uncharacterized protein n=1 Tax=Sclerotinia sclerotiorum (strain ATCC 18683 / 1980 / Ss-1) TaxID=665079 RepID=A7F648_SCLS1|nr:predicted protein [Sclerotinia sclerotiorum 1980 UF-70]EDN98219.1 predicted protein [Sclerotinia sclerotiorum 1980 UF-70]